MTFKSLMNFGNLGKAPWDVPLEHYHDRGDHHHGHHGNSKAKGGGSGAALSALTLLAFLFLLNVMQQSLQDNNSTTVPPTTAILLRETELPIVLDNGEEKDVKAKEDFVKIGNTHDSPMKTYAQRKN